MFTLLAHKHFKEIFVTLKILRKLNYRLCLISLSVIFRFFRYSLIA